jgi:hypothetical protein
MDVNVCVNVRRLLKHKLSDDHTNHPEGQLCAIVAPCAAWGVNGNGSLAEAVRQHEKQSSSALKPSHQRR